MTTVSSASGGARIRRHENARRPCREALPQRVRWSRMLTAAGSTPRAGRVAADLALDGGPGPRLEPGLEDGRDRAAVGRRDVDDDLVLVRATDPLDRRAPEPGPRRHEREAGGGRRGNGSWHRPQPAARDELGPIARLLGEVPAEPRLALGEERVDVTLRVGPAAPAGGRDGHDHATVRVDDDAQAARPRRAAKGVRERATGQARDGRGLGRDDGGRRVVRQRARPAVARPSRPPEQAARPLAGLGAVEDRRPAVDDDVVDAGRIDGAGSA